MLTSILLFALAATGLAQTPATPAVTIPEGYRKVLVTSMVNVKFVMVPKTRTNGSTVVVYEPHLGQTVPSSSIRRS
jgi:hypothetical protein